MILNIILQNSKPNNPGMVEVTGNAIHKTLVGNQLYIDSDVVLNMDDNDNSCNLFVDASNFKTDDKEIMRDKLKGMIDIFMDNL